MREVKYGHILFDTKTKQFMDKNGKLVHEMLNAYVYNNVENCRMEIGTADINTLEIWQVEIDIKTI